KNFSWFNNGYPSFGSAFTRAHPNLKWFCGIRFVREDFDPNFTAAFHITGHSNTGCFDLTACDPRTLQRLPTVFTEWNSSSAFCTAVRATALLFTIFDTFWH